LRMAANFREYYNSLSSNEEGNKNMEAFTNAFNGELSVEDRIRLAVGDHDNVIVAEDAEGNAVVLHSLANLGGTFRCKEDMIVAAVGMGTDPTGVVIAKTSMGVPVKAKGPAYKNLEACESTEDLRELMGDTKGGTHHGSNFFLLAPWAVESVNDAMAADPGNNNPLELILKVIKDGLEFDKENAKLDEDYQRARDHAEAFSRFLWLMSLDKIPEIKFLIPPDNDDLINYLSERKRKCIALPAVTANLNDSVDLDSNLSNQNDVLKQLAASISNQVESSKETNKISKLEYERKLDKDSKKSDGLGKLHFSVRHMLMNAASEDGDEMAMELPDSCKYFFEQDTAALSEQQLSFLLREEGLQDVGFAHGTVQALLTGHFLYNFTGCPSNFSIFSFHEKLKDGSETENTLLMHVMAKDGKARSKEDIKQSLKQVVVVPTNFNEMKEQLAIFVVISKKIMGKESLLPLGLKDFYRYMNRNASALKYKIRADELLPTKYYLQWMRKFRGGSRSVKWQDAERK